LTEQKATAHRKTDTPRIAATSGKSPTIRRPAQDRVISNFIHYSQPADNNKAAIRAQLALLFQVPARILEIGSGSGQHAVYMASGLPHLDWQPSDRGEYYEGLVENIRQLAPANVRPPLYLDVTETEFPPADHIYLANVLHIMPEINLPLLFRGAARTLPTGGKLCIYGPFTYGGAFTTQSNSAFDAWLKARNALSGIRAVETLQTLAQEQGFTLLSDTDMPANNQLLVFGKG
jgi:cyclopropane fatty-acyl-phospholipid synthase-like methyltransferase